MAKKALGRDLRDLLSQARPSRLVEGGAGGAAAEKPPCPAPANPFATAPTVSPANPTPVPLAPPAPAPDPAPVTVPTPHRSSVPVVQPGLNPSSKPPAGSLTNAGRPAAGPGAGSPRGGTSAVRGTGGFRPPTSPGFRREVGPDGSGGDRVGWKFFLAADLLLLGLAGYFVLAQPWGRGWSYGLAAGCVLVVVVMIGCALPWRGSTRAVRSTERVRPDRARIHVQLTRL